MLQNYFKVALRNLLKQKLFSIINIGGLAIGMAGFLLIIHYVRFERSYEKFHVNADNIVRVTLDLYKGSEYVVTDCETYAAFGPLVKEKMPEVVNYVRLMNHSDQEVKVGDQKFYEEGIYLADPSVFDVFSYTLLKGDKKHPLSEPYQVVITSSMEKKYFGNREAVGESLEIGGKVCKVTAILADVPPNTHFKFDFLISHSTVPKFWNGYSDEEWNTGNNEYTYLLMKPGTDLDLFNKKLKDLSFSLKDKIGTDRFVAEPIKDIHLYSNKTFEPEANGNARTVYFLLVISLFIIALAWINYINLSTAKAVERAREVGIRKVMGSLRSHLVFQFLSESAMVNLLSTGLALAIIYLSMPFFRELSGQPLPLDLFSDRIFWKLLAGLLLAGVVLSGLYPSAVLSSFEPVSVLKGQFRSSGHGQWLRKGLVVFQFAATMALIVCLGTVYLQINHLRKLNLGMTIDHVLSLRAPDLANDSVYRSKFQSFKTEILRDPTVQQVAGSGALPGLSLHQISTTNSIFRVGMEKKEGSDNYYHYSIDADFIPTFEMKLVAGRNFEMGKVNDDRVLINEQAAKTLGFSSSEAAIGEKITYRTRWKGAPAEVIGVVKNFNQRSPKEKQLPMIFRHTDGMQYFSLRLKTENVQETLTSVNKVWNQVFPSSPFVYFFMDENYNRQYKADAQFGQVIAVFSIVAVIIASLGLFGLSSYTILQRTKEIGIRKVLGGSVADIARLLSADFLKLVAGAGLLVMPVAYLLMQEWLSAYASRIELSVWLFIVPLITILVISLLTVSVQTIRAAQANPVNSLRSE